MLLTLAEVSPDRKQALAVLEQVFREHGKDDKKVQSEYLNALAEVDLAQAQKVEQQLAKNDGVDEQTLEQLIENGMPEKKKEKKTKDVVQQTKGGAEIFLPKKRKQRVRLPKNFDPRNPGPEPDPERWLPKWQRFRYKKYAKKKGIYLKGA